jgi:predicted DCC family thiol-disulfide oxidoreductase YuxK
MGAEEISALPDSIVVVDSDGVHTRSAAALRITRAVGFPYTLLGLGVVLPRPIRDAIYDLVARNRYRWFGREDTCMTPTPDVAERFLDADEPRPL